MTSTVKKITASESSFIANGNKYFFEFDLPIARYRVYEELQYLIAYGMNVEKLADALRKIIEVNSGPDVIGAIKETHEIATNALYSMGRNLAKREHEIFLFATLFIVREGEDLAQWSESIAKEKIKDWEVEGIAASSFFLLAMKQISGFQQLLEALRRDEKTDESLETLLPQIDDSQSE